MGELLVMQLDEFQTFCIKRQKETPSKRLYMKPEGKVCKFDLRLLSFHPKRWTSKNKLT